MNTQTESSRVSADDLALAASWLREYNDGELTDSRGVCEEAATMQRVARWLEAEVARREAEVQVRELVARVERETGKRPTRASVRNALARAKA